MATSFTLQNDPALPQGYLKVDGSTSATFTTSGITGSSLTDSSITASKLANNSVTASKLGTNEQKQICKAWVNFDGTTSPGTIRSSYNVSSVTKNGTGIYTVNFTNALADANYSLFATSAGGTTNMTGYGYYPSGGSYNATPAVKSTSQLQIATASNGGVVDMPDISVQIFGN